MTPFLLAYAVAATTTEPWSIPGASLLTWTGVIAVVCGLLLWGRLIPKSTHEREIKILTDRIIEVVAEKNEWRSAAQASEIVNQEVRSQNRMLLEQGQTTVYALEEIRRGLAQRAGDVKTP